MAIKNKQVRRKKSVTKKAVKKKAVTRGRVKKIPNKKTDRNPNGAGAKKIEVDFDVLKSLCEMFCTLEDIAGFFEVSEDTIERRCKEHLGMDFKDVFKMWSAKGRASLRRCQFYKAVNEGDSTMLIFLGKNQLGQRDKFDFDVNENIEVTFKAPDDLDEDKL